MTNKFASTKRAIAECDVCGFQFKLRELRSKVVRGRDTNILACPECFDGDHPQNKQGMFPVEDPQAIRNPRTPNTCLLYTSPSPRDGLLSRMPSSA